MAETQLGYTLLPPRREHSPGYSGADVIICDQPSGMHFDPKRMILSVVSSIKDVETLIIRHPWPDARYRLCAGAVHIEDAVGKEIELFTFGGELSIKPGPDCTQCEIRSPAPVLGNYAHHSVSRLLSEESEILLAQVRAEFLGDEQAYEQKLASVDPIDLYYASLNTLLDRFRRLPDSYDGLTNRLIHTMRSETDYLRTAPQSGRHLSASMKLKDLFQ